MNKTYKYWLWVIYPVGVVLLMLFSYKYIFSVDANKWAEANIKRKQVGEENIKMANLRDKLVFLEQVEQEEYTADLKRLLEAVPVSKKPWLTLAEINLTASRAGVAFSDFRGQIGEIKEATEAAKGEVPELYVKTSLDTENFEDLRNFLDILYKFKPLVSVRSLVWEGGEMDLEVEVGYRPWPKLDPDPESFVSGNLNRKTELLKRVEELESVSSLNLYKGMVIGDIQGGEEISPF